MISIKSMIGAGSFLLLFQFCAFSQTQKSDTVSSALRHIILSETEIKSTKKLKALIFSSFEKKIHISLNPHHDEYRYTLERHQPDRFIAAQFQHNDTARLNIYKIEGILQPFDSSVVEVEVKVIYRGKIMVSIPLSPTMIKKNRFMLKLENLIVSTGEIYVLYTCRFKKPGSLNIVVNPGKDSKRFSFSEDGRTLLKRNDYSFRFKVPAPQFKVYCIQE